MRRTLRQQVDANRRASVFFSFLVVVLLAAMGALITGMYDYSIWWMGAAGAAALGAIVALVSWSAGPSIILNISQAREATPLEISTINNVTEEMAIAAGVPKPQVFIIDDTAPNAFATGKNPDQGVVVVTSGLMEKLNRDELQGVVAHEIGHIRNNDIRLMTTLALVAGLIPLLADFYLRSLWWGGGRRSRSSDGEGGAAQAIFVVVGIVLAILAPLFAKLLELAVSRKRELLADATAAELTRYPEGLASALEKIASDPEPLEAANRATAPMYIVNPLRKLEERTSSLFSTHPPLEERIQALRSLAGASAPRIPLTPTPSDAGDAPG